MAILDKLEKFTSRDRAAESNPTESKGPQTPEEHIVQDGESSDLSLFARNEKEVEQNPDQITQNAHLGVQKAEATTLVWPKQAVYASYAW